MVALEWMKKDFDAATKEKADGCTRVLLMDGHSSHYSLELLEFAWANNIIILGYPPHCTHALQGLDVVCFAKMKKEFHEEINRFEDLQKSNIMKADFAGVFGCAFLCAFSEDTVKAAFAATGVHPFNPDAISDKQLKPSLSTSTKGSFPLPQPSPVRTIIAAMTACPPTSFDLSPTHFAPLAGPSHRGPSTSPSPSARQWTPDPNIDPELQTPSKRIRLMYGTLASTSSGSMLVLKTRMTSAYTVTTPVFEPLPKLPQPDWSYLQNQLSNTYQSHEVLQHENAKLTKSLCRLHAIICAQEAREEACEAQIVIQNAHLIKLNDSLHAKENKKKNDRTALFVDGFGRHLTDAEFTSQLRAQNERQAAEAAEKEQRQAG